MRFCHFISEPDVFLVYLFLFFFSGFIEKVSPLHICRMVSCSPPGVIAFDSL